MDKFRILEIKQSVFENNDREAAKLRGELKEQGVFLLNLMSSPGAGKQLHCAARSRGLRTSFP
jgi:hydrogenase nickel incorporation protein HypB